RTLLPWSHHTAPHHGRYNLVRNMEVPERRFIARSELLQQSSDLIEAGDGSAIKAETLGDALKRTTTKHRPAVIQLVGSQLMDLPAIGTVVQHAYKDRKVVATNCVESLRVHHEPAVTTCQDDWLLRSRRGDADSVTELVADRAEFADRREMICTNA